MLCRDYLYQEVEVLIDRPLGSQHPQYGFIYPLNYGFIENTVSGDGEELDAYLLGVFEPVERYRGVVIAVIQRTNDNDDKLIVVPHNVDYSDEQIRALREFQERYFNSVILR